MHCDLTFQSIFFASKQKFNLVLFMNFVQRRKAINVLKGGSLFSRILRKIVRICFSEDSEFSLSVYIVLLKVWHWILVLV